MVGYESVVASIPTPDWKDKAIIDVQDTDDIIKDLIFCFKKYNDQAAPVAKKFSTGHITSDAKLIWEFIRHNIKYEAEPEKYQTTRSFSRIIHDKFGDCKHSALLASSIAWNLGYNIIFRFVGYDRGTTYGHVYTLIENPRTGKKVVIDPLQPFNTEKSFYKKQDYKATNNLTPNPMLSRLTGTETTSPTRTSTEARTNTSGNVTVTMNGRTNTPDNANISMSGNRFRKPYIHPDETRMRIGEMEIIMSPSVSGSEADTLDGLCGIGKRSKSERKEHRAQTRANRQEKHATKKDARHEKHAAHKDKRVAKREARGGSRLKKISLAPVRGAFSTLLLVNFRGYASRLQESISVNEGEVKKFAAKLGYKYDNLKKQITKGATHKPLLGAKVHGVVHDLDGIGVVIGAAAIAAAAPAILLCVQLFKSLGIGGKGAETDAEAVSDAAKDVASGGGDTNVNVNTGGGGGGDTPSASGGGGGGGGSESSGGGGGSEVATSSKSSGSDAGGGGSDSFYEKYKTPILFVGAAGVLYLANKQFKIF